MKCICGKSAIHYRDWEKKFYCGPCLSRHVERTFKHTIRKSELIKNSKKIAVAVSGGKDSNTTLYLMSKIKAVELIAISIDEGIAGYIKQTLQSAKKLCNRLNIEHNIISFKKEFGFSMDSIDKNYCSYCGVLRRHLLNKTAHKFGADKIAVGHNMDDEAQSILLNFIRGDMNRFQRLGVSPHVISNKKFVPRIKPLRNIREKEIVLYAMLNRIPFAHASCPYSAHNQRRSIMNFIDKIESEYPDAVIQIVRFYDNLRPMLNKSASKVKINFCQCGEPCSGKKCMACRMIEDIRNER